MCVCVTDDKSVRKNRVDSTILGIARNLHRARIPCQLNQGQTWLPRIVQLVPGSVRIHGSGVSSSENIYSKFGS